MKSVLSIRPGLSTTILSILINVIFFFSVDGQCVYKTEKCSCTQRKVLCVGLTTIPELRDDLGNETWTSVEFHDGKLTAIPPLPPGTKSASFSNVPLSNVSYLDPSVTTLNELNIGEAKFRRLPGAFQKLESLTTLIISDTPLEGLDNTTMAILGQSLTSLILDNVNITVWPPEISNLHILNQLGILKNPLLSIPDNAFTSMASSLTTLYFVNLGLTSTPKALLILKNLDSLDLSQNNLPDLKSVLGQMSSSQLASTLTSLTATSVGLTDFPGLNQFSSLATIILDDNPIRNIHGDSLPSTLSLFSCSNCSLSSFPPEIDNIKNLTFAYFTHNTIHTVNFDVFPTSVQKIYLTNNKITEFSCQDHTRSSLLQSLSIAYNLLPAIPACIRHLSRLSKLSIQGNLITQINFDSFPSNLTYLVISYNQITNIRGSNSTSASLLTYVDLNSNPISDIDPLAFVNLVNLKTLILDETRLTKIPLALTSLTALTDLSVLFNLMTSCPCPVDKDLSDWFKSRNGSLQITGSCKPFVDIIVYFTDYCDRT